MSHSTPRSRPLLPLVGAGIALAATAAFAAPASAQTENPNNMSCDGYIKKGTSDPDAPGVGVVEYRVGCSAPLTGYSLIASRAVTSYETEIFAFDIAHNELVPTDSFSCNGDLPGFAVNCTGSTSWGWRMMPGTFEIAGDVCAEPRVSVMMMATTATADAKGKVTQSIAGPFSIGRPRGCPPSAQSGKPLLPKDVDETSTFATIVAAAKRKAAARKKATTLKAGKKKAKLKAKKASTKRTTRTTATTRGART